MHIKTFGKEAQRAALFSHLGDTVLGDRRLLLSAFSRGLLTLLPPQLSSGSILMNTTAPTYRLAGRSGLASLKTPAFITTRSVGTG